MKPQQYLQLIYTYLHHVTLSNIAELLPFSDFPVECSIYLLHNQSIWRTATINIRVQQAN